jgi:hypothetical protein
MWKSLVWFYKHPYFTRVWAIQEVNANKERLLPCGLEKVLWDRVSLVACYITADTAFSKAFGFSNAYCLLVGRDRDDGFGTAKKLALDAVSCLQFFQSRPKRCDLWSPGHDEN